MKAAAPLLAATLAAFASAALPQGAGRTAAPTYPPVALNACVPCHGDRGEGNAAAGYPRIAGQSAYYIARQLESYANGSRRDPVMEPIAKGLPREVSEAIAAFYARIDDGSASRARSRRAAANERGRTLAVRGDAQRGVQACNNCHGPGGVGEPPAIPYLAGLDARYLAAELEAWKEGSRRNDAGGQMVTVAKALSADDARAVAEYYASLSPPRAAPVNIVHAPVARPKPEPGATPVAPPGSDTPSMVGVEQGAPGVGGTHAEGGEGASKDGSQGASKDMSPDASKGASRDRPKGASKSAAQSRDEPRAPDGGPAADEATPAPGSAPALGSGSAASAKAVPPTDAKSRAPTSAHDPAPAHAAATVSGKLSAAHGDAKRGKTIVESGVHGCTGCHSIPGIRWPKGIVGPPLAGMMQRPFIAGQLPNRPDMLAEFLRDPPALVPRTGMPNVGLTADEAQDIAAFLLTLGPPDAR